MLRPTQDYILVKTLPRAISPTLIAVTSEKYTQGTIVAVGPGKRDKRGKIRPLDAKPGDFITFGDLERGYDFYPHYTEDGITYRVLQEDDIAFIAEADNPAHSLSDAEISQLVSDSRTLVIN